MLSEARFRIIVQSLIMKYFSELIFVYLIPTVALVTYCKNQKVFSIYFVENFSLRERIACSTVNAAATKRLNYSKLLYVFRVIDNSTTRHRRLGTALHESRTTAPVYGLRTTYFLARYRRSPRRLEAPRPDRRYLEPTLHWRTVQLSIDLEG